MYKFHLFLFYLFFVPIYFSNGQDLAFGSNNIDDYLRLNELFLGKDSKLGFNLRFNSGSPNFLIKKDDTLKTEKKEIRNFSYNFLPIYSSFKFDQKRPYVGGEYGLIPSRGGQIFLSTGVNFKLHKFSFQFQPEFILSENLAFFGFPKTFDNRTIEARFLFWNVGDSPERFGTSFYKNFFLGQSSISFQLGSFEAGLGTRNFWWGPGQWNSLIFSNNAPGFPYFSLNTIKPAKTFLGKLEGQILMGRLESSNFEGSQIDSLNSKYFSDLNSDWRYLNGLMLSLNPRWIPNFSLGFMRTFQYYNKERPNDFFGWFPVFEPMAKENLFLNGNSVVYDSRKQSQQIAIFSRIVIPKSKFEAYFQFGRRDHSLNWREFLLNPEHGRAYQLGFIKLVQLPSLKKFIKIGGEITNQKEAINRIVRYNSNDGFNKYTNGQITWHTHRQVRGFTNFGQPMGVGIGTGSNSQTLEISFVEDWNKFGIIFERLENNQDFYYRAFIQQNDRKPWVDWSSALLWNSAYKGFFISARLQGTLGRNYQWLVSESSTFDFPVSKNLFSIHSQVNLIYFWNRNLKNEKKVLIN